MLHLYVLGFVQEYITLCITSAMTVGESEVLLSVQDFNFNCELSPFVRYFFL